MSKTLEEELTLESAMADFDTFLNERAWSDARALVDNLEELGYDTSDFSEKLKRAVWVDKISQMDGVTFKNV